MGVKRYLSVGGQLLGEYQVDTDDYVGYMSDALGNVSSTVGSSGDKLNEYLYSPFGEMVKKTGTSPDPKYLWCGTWGYRANGNKWVSHYVRASHYSFADAAWMSRDARWPSQMPYGYVNGRVIVFIDYFGREPLVPFRPAWEPVAPPWVPRWFPNLRRITPTTPWGLPPLPWTPLPKPPASDCCESGQSPSFSNPTFDLRVGRPLNLAAKWNYGNYCGLLNTKHGSCRPEPKDCMDDACREHDDCLEVAHIKKGGNAYFGRTGTYCNCLLLKRAYQYLLGGCIGHNSVGLRGWNECQNAARDITIMFGAICLGTNGIHSLTGPPVNANDDPLVLPEPGQVGSDQPWRMWHEKPFPLKGGA